VKRFMTCLTMALFFLFAVEVSAQSADELAGRLSKPSQAPSAVFELARKGAEAKNALTKALSSRDAGVRYHALWALTLGGMKVDEPTIAKLIDDDNSLVRLRAVFAAAKQAQVEPILKRLASDSDELVRASAATVLADFREKTVTDALLDSLERHGNRFSALSLVSHRKDAGPGLRKLAENVKPEVRRMACFALGRIGDEESIDVLGRAARDKDSDVAVSASIALALLRQDEAYSLLEDALKKRGQSAHNVPELMKKVVSALSHLKGATGEKKAGLYKELGKCGVMPPLPELVGELRKGKTRGLRVTAARTLGEIGSDMALGALTEAAGEADGGIRLAAAEALGKIAARDCVAALRSLSYDPEPAVRAAAATSLAELDIRDRSPVFKRMAKDENENVRAAAIRALDTYPPSFAEPVLISLYKKEKSLDIRALMVRLLGEIATENALHIILKAADSKEIIIKGEAVEALGNFKNERAVQKLISVLKNYPLIDNKIAAVRGLGRSSSDLALPVLMKWLGKGGDELAVAVPEALGNLGAGEAVPALIKHLKDAKGERAIAIVEALGKIAENDSISVIVAAAKDDSRPLRFRRAAVVSLGYFKGERAAGIAATGFLSDDSLAAEAAAALGRLGRGEGIVAIVRLLKKKDAAERLRAVYALEHCRSDHAVTLLMKAARDEDVPVALSAAVELVKRDKIEGIAFLQAILARDDASEKLEEVLKKIDTTELLQPLIERLAGTGDVKTRMAVVEILGRTGLAGYGIPKDASLEEYEKLAERWKKWWDAVISRLPADSRGK